MLECNELQSNSLEKKILYLIAAGVFVFIFSYFSFANPIVPYDGDDWNYLGSYRAPVPIWGSWNPTRVLPEILLPLTGYIAAYVVYPLIHDYLLSITIVTSLFIALTITGFFVLLTHTFKNILDVKTYIAVGLSLIFLALHFILFFSKSDNNMYLLFTFNLTTIFYYLIPDFLNCSLILLFITHQDFNTYFFNQLTDVKKCIFIIAAYFAIFSNVFCSEILGVYCFTMLCIAAFSMFRNFSLKKNTLYLFIKNQKIYISILLVWLISLFMEAHGGRAHMVGPSKMDIGSAFQFFLSLTMLINHRIAAIFLVIIIAMGIFLIKKDSALFKQTKLLTTLVYCFIAIFPMIIVSLLAAAKSVPFYAGIPNSMYGIFFLVLFSLLLCTGFLIKKYRVLSLLMPLGVIFILVFLMKGIPVMPSNTSHLTSNQCLTIDRAIIQQIVDADKNGKDKIDLKVPVWSGDNWPHSKDFVKSLPRTLYKHGIISRPIQTTMVKDENFYKQYEINIKK